MTLDPASRADREPQVCVLAGYGAGLCLSEMRDEPGGTSADRNGTRVDGSSATRPSRVGERACYVTL